MEQAFGLIKNAKKIRFLAFERFDKNAITVNIDFKYRKYNWLINILGFYQLCFMCQYP